MQSQRRAYLVDLPAQLQRENRLLAQESELEIRFPILHSDPSRRIKLLKLACCLKHRLLLWRWMVRRAHLLPRRPRIAVTTKSKKKNEAHIVRRVAD